MKTLSCTLFYTGEKSQLFGYKHARNICIIGSSHRSTGCGVMANFMGTHSSEPCSWQIRMLPICYCLSLFLWPWGGWPNSPECHHSLDGTEPRAGDTKSPAVSLTCLRHLYTPEHIYRSAMSRGSMGTKKVSF